ncbi:MAG: non-ribosomal peptide synthetase, partial [Planctomycetaceae bacterium]|nr:non-ribosomal peptide synthetase [Planctomycetaceae bacterium]
MQNSSPISVHDRLSPDSMDFCSLVALTRARAGGPLKSVGFEFFDESSEDMSQLTFAMLDSRAMGLAASLQQRIEPGDRVMLLFYPGLDYIAAFFACLYAGAVAVPTYPPRPRQSADRIRGIIEDAEPTVILSTSELRHTLQQQVGVLPTKSLRHWLALDEMTFGAENWIEPPLSQDSVAYLQYTSGSTSAPKGVVLTHANLLHNLGLIYSHFGHSPQSRGVIWLPPFHDMGLIGGILQPVYGGFPVTLMSPHSFIQRPLLWLDLISKKRGTTSGGPNFAYDLCARRATTEQLRDLDLSSWDVAFCGAE